MNFFRIQADERSGFSAKGTVFWLYHTVDRWLIFTANQLGIMSRAVIRLANLAWRRVGVSE